MSEPYVMRMRPHLVEKVWGGRKLETHFGKTLPGPGGFGESWEVADLPEGQSMVANGVLAGKPLRSAVESWGESLVGIGRSQFPLLVKLLDAAQDLSIQVHPGDDYSSKHPMFDSKDESWVILDADPGGQILYGMAAKIEAQAFEDSVKSGTVVERLRSIEVAPGDVYRVAPRTVHAICAGVALLEIQEPSDTTFRVYDYGRPGLDGAPRELHLEQALEVMSFEQASDSQMASGGLVSAPNYRIERQNLEGSVSWKVDPSSPQVIHVIEGSLTIDGVTLAPHQTAVIPACLGEVTCIGSGVVIGASAGPPVFG